MLISAYRVVRFAFQNIWRNGWLSLITLSMLTLTLLTVNVMLIVHLVSQRAISYVENRIEISAYFEPQASEETVRGAAEYLRDLSQVRDVEYVTAEEALEDFRVRHADDAPILQSLDEVGENPFGAALVIKAHSAKDFPFILDALEHPSFRSQIREKELNNYDEIIGRIRVVTERVRAFALGLTLIFLVIAILIVFNTVRIGLFIHREEIGIMKLVGASDRFIRSPFFLQSLIYSALATALVAAAMFPAAAFLDPRLNAYFSDPGSGLLAYFQSHWFLVFGTQFLGLALVNFFSTQTAMRRYLRV